MGPEPQPLRAPPSARTKKALTEQDIRSKFISPAILAAGWDAMHQLREEVQLTNGRVIVRGKISTRGEAKRADYVLYHRPDLPIAVVEAKDNNHALGAGMQQALGPLRRFVTEIVTLQAKERARVASDPAYQPRLRVAIVTARDAPAHTRVITTLRAWGIQVDEAFFLGGLDKAGILRVFRPHIFFDEQLSHVEGASSVMPCVQVPFGVANVGMVNAADGS